MFPNVVSVLFESGRTKPDDFQVQFLASPDGAVIAYGGTVGHPPRVAIARVERLVGGARVYLPDAVWFGGADDIGKVIFSADARMS